MLLRLVILPLFVGTLFAALPLRVDAKLSFDVPHSSASAPGTSPHPPTLPYHRPTQAKVRVIS